MAGLIQVRCFFAIFFWFQFPALVGSSTSAGSGTCACTTSSGGYCIDSTTTPRHSYFCTNEIYPDRCASAGGRNWIPSGLCVFTQTNAANENCNATKLADNATSAGNCTDQMQRNESCFQAPKSGFACAVTRCNHEGILSIGTCTIIPQRPAWYKSGVFLSSLFYLIHFQVRC